jgi:hypothetical protein
VGKALKGWRETVKVSTKCPMDVCKTPKAVREMLDKSLKKLDVGYIDFYHMWGINWGTYEDVIRGAVYDDLMRAKAEGLIRHLSFSFHDEPGNLARIADTGLFESVLCQYNLLDRANEASIAHARAKGLGVAVMGPIGGGRLGAPSREILGMLPGGTRSSAEIALRFVLSNPDVSCALSGMGSMEMVEENVEVASRPMALTETEKAQVLASMEEKKKLADLYCTGCRYCMPCPQGVDIPKIFELMNLHRVYGQTEAAKRNYQHLGLEWDKDSLPVSSCIECGACEEKCPQGIEIRKRLKETEAALGR